VGVNKADTLVAVDVIQNHIQKQGGLSHPGPSQDIHVKPSIFPLYPEELSFVSEIGYRKEVYIRHKAKSSVSHLMLTSASTNNNLFLSRIKKGKTAPRNKLFHAVHLFKRLLFQF
jgi:hypothetical protein